MATDKATRRDEALFDWVWGRVMHADREGGAAQGGTIEMERLVRKLRMEASADGMIRLIARSSLKRDSEHAASHACLAKMLEGALLADHEWITKAVTRSISDEGLRHLDNLATGNWVDKNALPAERLDALFAMFVLCGFRKSFSSDRSYRRALNHVIRTPLAKTYGRLSQEASMLPDLRQAAAQVEAEMKSPAARPSRLTISHAGAALVAEILMAPDVPEAPRTLSGFQCRRLKGL